MQRLTSRSLVLTLCVLCLHFPGPADAETYVTKWGSVGGGNGEFNQPTGVATDAAGNVYVVEQENARVQKFTSAGAYITQWGSFGSGVGQFDHPYGLCTDAAGNVYVVDRYNHRVQKFTATGTFISQWGSNGSGDGQFEYPTRVATDASGNVYVVDQGNNRVQKFTGAGGYITQWGSPGSGAGQFNSPIGVAADAAGNVYVVDANNHRIQKFTASGAYVTQWGTHGGGEGQFDNPADVATDALGNVYVADYYNQRIQRFADDGTYKTQWGSGGTFNGEFNFPVGVATSPGGDIYVADLGNHRIQKFTNDAPLVSLDLDFTKLPSSQQPTGPDWSYSTLNSYTEAQVFHVGLNGASQPTLFQNTMGVGLPGADANCYVLTGILDPKYPTFSIDVRAAVLEEELHPSSPNHFGFAFACGYGGKSVFVAVGTSAIEVDDATGKRTLPLGFNNTGYHDYLLSGSIRGSWLLYRDLVLIGTGNFRDLPQNRVLLGDASAGANARAEITRFRFSQNNVAAVPRAVAAQGLHLALGSNPARHDLSVSFTLTGSESAALDVLDLQGRRVAALDLSGLGPGAHELVLPRPESMHSALYWIRLRQGTQFVARKVAWLH